MKSNNLFAMAVLVTCLSVQAADMSTFNEERTKYHSYKDPTRLSYLYNRCAALQLNVAALLSRKNEVQGAKNFEALAQHYMVLSEANERAIDKQRGLKSKDTVKTVNRSVAHVAEVYTKRMKANFAKRGDYIVGDAQLESELAECNLPEEFKKKALAN
jgi:hypothetical protein